MEPQIFISGDNVKKIRRISKASAIAIGALVAFITYKSNEAIYGMTFDATQGSNG